jgi:polyhydroxyalkanoate synthesis repressor PhaR
MSTGVELMIRLVKKYANRRLYDVETSQYITLEDLKKLIVDGENIEVQDAKTKSNITREVLLQLVAEQEHSGQPILNEAVLKSMIQFYGHPMQKLASQYLEMSLNQLQGQRVRLREQMKTVMQSPADMLSAMTHQNVDWMKQLQDQFLNTLNPGKPSKTSKSE